MNLKLYDISVVFLIMFVTKIFIDVGIPKKFAPLITLFLSILVGIIYFSPQDIFKGIIIGVFIAASSIGFYSGPKNVYQQYKNNKDNKDKNLEEDI